MKQLVGERSLVEYRPSVVLVFLLCAQLVPSLPMYFGKATSMAAGETVSAAFILFLSFFFWLCQPEPRRGTLMPLFRPGFLLSAAGLVAVVLLHATIADSIGPINASRFFPSVALLLLNVASAYAFSNALHLSLDASVDRAVRISFVILWLLIVLRLFHLQPGHLEYEKSTFPFTETSHFSLAFCPVLMYVCVTSTGLRRSLWLGVSFGLAVILQSMVLLAASFLIAAMIRRLTVVGLPLMAVFIVLIPVELQYFVARLDFSANTSNLSALVYLQGWQQLIEGLTSTSYWGLGFQQMGEHQWQASAAYLIEVLTNGVPLNLSDGSFVMAKIGSEFGLFGVLAALAALVISGRALLDLRRDVERCTLTFVRCIAVSFSIDILIRGTGYFTQSTYLFLVALCFLLTARKSSAVEHSVQAPLQQMTLA